MYIILFRVQLQSHSWHCKESFCLLWLPTFQGRRSASSPPTFRFLSRMMERLEEHTGGVSCSTEHQMVDSLGPEFLDLSQTVADIRQVLFANTLFFCGATGYPCLVKLPVGHNSEWLIINGILLMGMMEIDLIMFHFCRQTCITHGRSVSTTAKRKRSWACEQWLVREWFVMGQDSKAPVDFVHVDKWTIPGAPDNPDMPHIICTSIQWA